MRLVSPLPRLKNLLAAVPLRPDISHDETIPRRLMPRPGGTCAANSQESCGRPSRAKSGKIVESESPDVHTLHGARALAIVYVQANQSRGTRGKEISHLPSDSKNLQVNLTPWNLIRNCKRQNTQMLEP